MSKVINPTIITNEGIQYTEENAYTAGIALRGNQAITISNNNNSISAPPTRYFVNNPMEVIRHNNPIQYYA